MAPIFNLKIIIITMRFGSINNTKKGYIINYLVFLSKKQFIFIYHAYKKHIWHFKNKV